MIETFENPSPGRDYVIRHVQEEFTSVCPLTGHPDFATVVFTYAPRDVCLELKSMKVYLHGYRNEGIFFEAATNRMFDDFFAAAKPKWARVETVWKGRGGIRSVITVEDGDADYAGPKAAPYE